MKIQQIRNATLVIETKGHRILVDPMLAAKGALPPLRFFGATQRNPIVDLPESAACALEQVTHCLITHCQKGHFDHLDRAGKRWLRDRQIPVFCTQRDAPHLSGLGLNVQALPESGPAAFFDGVIHQVRCTHGRGLVGKLMEHGVGYLIDLPGEPSVYVAGDTVLTPRIREFVARHQPQVNVVPAGGARFDIGGDIIMGVDEVIEFTRIARGVVIANHLEAISHCPTSRADLTLAAVRAGVSDRLLVPADGQTLAFGLSDTDGSIARAIGTSAQDDQPWLATIGMPREPAATRT